MLTENIILDNFQKDAIEHIDKNNSVIVAAPTGAGKTLIAEYAIEKCLKENKGLIYTAPIKALSNQKFRDFSKNFPQKVGIITGDVRINPRAPILIMTTEIFRNYLLQEPEKLKDKKWVIFDEVHYLDDPERGTVWEESIIFLPPEMRILALSATLPNVGEFKNWIKKVHNQNIIEIEEAVRPVPLHFYFQADNQIFSNLKDLKKYSSRERGKFFLNNRIDSLIKHLKTNGFLPCIYFCFSRKKCENYAKDLSQFNFLTEEEKRDIKNLYKELVKKFKIEQHTSTHDMLHLLERGIAYHHAGLLPPLKEIIERIFTKKMIKVIFTTETFALGINMPSRTVCFDEIAKHYKRRAHYLSTRDFYQMAGRAGRRGIDEEGYVFVKLKPFKDDIEKMEIIARNRPELIKSQFNASYATILNLYNDIQDEIITIYPKSFHYFQNRHRKSREAKMLSSKLKLLKNLGYIKNQELTLKGKFSSNVFGYELIVGELYEAGFFENISWIELTIVICAIITESRAKDTEIKLDKGLRKLRLKITNTVAKIQKIEKTHRIYPRILKPHFQLAQTLQAWLRGSEFNKIINLTSLDEGAIVRNFRMTNQVLRDMNQRIISENLREKINKASSVLNRDIVNAEWQLKI
ncbi:MAG: DEAD/DEAH box helicase [Candidatus Kaelpia aquatica]|nr:DEAD/DEAH box helicase [Candidatus Kaelpia aquatica]